jgi:hypothetical protein
MASDFGMMLRASSSYPGCDTKNSLIETKIEAFDPQMNR